MELKKKIEVSRKKVQKFVKKPENKKYLVLAVVLTAVFVIYKKYGNGKKAASGTGTNNGSTGTTTFPDNSANADGALGSYKKVVAGREYSYSRTPELELEFNEDGTISDITPGLSFDGISNRIGNKRIYYMLGYSVFQNANNSYNQFRNVFLPDGIYTIRQFVCDENVVPNLAAFKQKLTGWNNGVNMTNSRLSEVFLAIKTLNATGNSVVPRWLKVSRHLVFPSVVPQKDWAAYNKFFCIVYQNQGSSAEDYQKFGINTDLDYNVQAAQPKTWNTVRKGDPSIQDNNWYYQQGRSWIEKSGVSKRFVLTDQYPEDAQNTDPDIDTKMYHFYKGALDRISEVHGPTNKKNTGLYGSYGIDDFSKLIVADHLKFDRQTFEQSLTSHVHKVYDPASSSWAGDASYYATGAINVRNVNHSFYMYNNIEMIPYRIIYVNERIKVGTKTYQGQDRESNILGFGWAKAQSLVTPFGIGIEYASTGEIIPFPGGEIKSVQNLEIPMPWEENFTCGFWCTLIFSGLGMWNAPGSRFGKDASKLHWWTDQQVQWKKNGGNWEPYVSGQNGAPVNDSSGLMHRLWAPPTDAAYAGSDAVWKIRDRIQVLEHVSYTSSKGNFTAVPGTSGLHLNGFGSLNKNLFVIKDAYDGQKGVALRGSGQGGKVLIYYNGFLSPHEYEDNVIMDGVNLGRVYGRQTVIRTI
ncbi:hypothetical protein [Dyadobacter sediminis]|uniref:Uncharacterized protein n=2 Tax=Dyadobacter sediminis TaxID=1493691 RepID=A0A5R9KB84_9BACT|nr:hypothetical protein [Dyadobacter sediminis]TLU91977.1 hypothetical protein FEM55_14545 [Dyadobacter sediminis]